MIKPWYKSLKKWIGIIFLAAVLFGGLSDISNPETKNTMDVLELFAGIGLIALGLTGVFKGMNKFLDGKNDSKD